MMPERGHLPIGWHVILAMIAADGAMPRARALLDVIHMNSSSRSSGRVADIIGRLFNRFVAVTVGVVLMIVGLGMMVTIVAFPVGVVLEVLGVLILVYGLLTPDGGAERGDTR